MESKSLKKQARPECKAISKSLSRQGEAQADKQMSIPQRCQLSAFLYQNHEDVDRLIGHLVRQAVSDCLSSLECKTVLKDLTDRCAIVERQVIEASATQKPATQADRPLQRSKSTNIDQSKSLFASSGQIKVHTEIKSPISMSLWKEQVTLVQKAKADSISQHIQKVVQVMDRTEATQQKIRAKAEELKGTIKDISSKHMQRKNEVCSFSDFHSGAKPLSSIKKLDTNFLHDTPNQAGCLQSQIEEYSSPDSKVEDSSEATVYLVCNTQLELFFENGDPITTGDEANQVKLSSEQFDQMKDRYFLVK